jgi:hypothetical protein
MTPGGGQSGHGRRTSRQHVQVKHGEHWCPGTLRSWHTDAETGERLGLVSWSPVPGEVRIDRFHESQILES